MYFNKIYNPQNFSFPESIDGSSSRFTAGALDVEWKIDDLGEDVFRLTYSSNRWPEQFSQAALEDHLSGISKGSLSIGQNGQIQLTDKLGNTLISSARGQSFGVCGRAWLMSFSSSLEMQFYGMGEKNLAFERSGVETKFWNLDVGADFHETQYKQHVTDPMYVSVPYLIIKQDNLYAGILINNPFAVFMSTPPEAPGASKERANHARPNYYIGSPDGVPEIYFLAGPTFAELTSKLQRLVGTTPLPPLWALGHQQCRYGYAGYKDLDEIERKMKRHRIPNDGIWLDIDYMDGYRVFSFSPRHWRNPKLDIEEISSRGKKVVPILDPGVKVDLGYAPYNDGIEQDIFCKTPENKPFQGFVWPGLTVFPDFSTDAGREWWAGYVERFAQNGVAGAWLDMNDPAVGHAELDPMRFGEGGKNSHETFHNQYAFGMAKASREGFLRADENTRPFLLARSGYISSSRYSAIWTGDNASNAWFFKQSLSVILGLAISGIPFNGADVGGFGDDVNKELLVAWYKSAFLLPFFRNHTCCGTHRQEPWAFDQEALETIRHFIRLRYKLLPYIYNLFIDQEENGEAIVRPLFYDFEDEKKLPLGKIDDQYMLGRSIMHAPILQTDRAMRDIALPKGLWFDAMTGIWIEGGSMLKDVETTVDSTPLYIRSGSIIPMLSGSATDNNSDLSTIECHIFLCPSQRSSARYTYRFDDGKSFAYKRGERTIIGINAYSEGRKLKVDLQNIRAGYKSASIQFVVYGPYAEIELTVNDRPAVLKLKNHPWIFAGAELNAKVSAPVSIG